MEFLRNIWDMLFAGDKPTPRSIQRMRKAATQPHGEAATRVNAAWKLAKWGSPESVSALLQRFTIQTSSGAVDLEEKQQVRDWLVEVGEVAVKPILAYLETGEEATYPVQTLEKLLPEDQLIERVTELLERLGGVHTRTPKGKIALIEVLAAYDDPRVPTAVTPFLSDPDDDVAFGAIDCLARPVWEEAARESLLELLVSAEGRPRIQSHLLEALVELNWPVKGYRRRLEQMLPDGFVLTGKGQLRARGDL
jgi:hypothetical protein